MAAGNIAVFHQAGKLQELDLSRTQVEGDISSFSNSPKLRRLHIFETGLFGDIQALQGANKLQELLAWYTDLRGDIEVFSPVSASLSKISMGGSFVYGNLKALSNATNLTLLGFTQCNVSGDIVALAQHTQLAEIWLAESNTFGDISALGNMKIEKVFLDLTNVSGNLEVFLASRETVQLISLSNTDVDGSMGVFHRAPSLQDLNLAGTHMSGEQWQKHAKTLNVVKLGLIYMALYGCRSKFTVPIHTLYSHAIHTPLEDMLHTYGPYP